MKNQKFIAVDNLYGILLVLAIAGGWYKFYSPFNVARAEAHIMLPLEIYPTDTAAHIDHPTLSVVPEKGQAKWLGLSEILANSKPGSTFKESEIRDYLAKGNTLRLAILYSREIGCPPSVFIAQSILESRLGQSSLVKKTGNDGNIKCKLSASHSRCKRSPRCHKGYDKIEKGWDYYVSFDSHWESWKRKKELLKNYKVIENARNKGIRGYKNWCEIFHHSPYASDEDYAKKLVGIIHTYGLNYLDTAVEAKVPIATDSGKFILYRPKA